MLYLYHVCGIRVIFSVPFTVTMQKESEEFLETEISGYTEADLWMQFFPVDKLPEPPFSDGHQTNKRLYVESGERMEIYHLPAKGYPPYASVIWPEDRQDTVRCDYLRGKESYMNYSHNLSDLLGLETLLLRFQGLLLHASFIRWEGKGILFSAPSGTGKSTQADLWEKYEGAETINGDRAGLRRTDGRWNAFGLPYAGSSGIYRNESAPLEGIIALRQAPENRIRRLRPAEAFTYLYPEFSVHRWHRQFVEQASRLIGELLGDVPVWLLECRPDKEAVELVKETITGLRPAKGG